MKCEAAYDGLDEFGFPFVFYNHFEGKCIDCYSKFGFKPSGFLGDIAVAISVAWLIIYLWKKLRQNANT